MNVQAPHTCYARAKERGDDPLPVMNTMLLRSKQRGQTVTGKNTITLTQHDKPTDKTTTHIGNTTNIHSSSIRSLFFNLKHTSYFDRFYQISEPF
jgi:hypothetical protein